MKGKVIAISAFSIVFVGSAAAESWQEWVNKADSKYESEYNRSGFDLYDVNHDGYLDANELRDARGWVSGEGISGKERVFHADKDGDGRISLEEAKLQKRWEKDNWKKLGKDYRKQIVNWYDDTDYLQKHPKVLEELVNREGYLKDHPKVAAALLSNKEFLAKHPNLSKRVYSHKSWFDSHPQAAKAAYRNRKGGYNFAKNHPAAARGIYKHKKAVAAHPKAARRAAKGFKMRKK